MAAELGDTLAGPKLTVTKPSDGTNMSAGDAVTANASNQVAPTGSGDDLFGVVLGPARSGVDLSSLSAGDPVTVLFFGGVVVNAGGSVTEGDLLETSSTSGRLAQNSQGTEYTVDDGSLSATATQDVGSISAQTTNSFTVSVSGATAGDPVSVSPPSGFSSSPENNDLVTTAYVSSSDTVTVLVTNPTSGAIDPDSGDYTVEVHQDSTDTVAAATAMALGDSGGQTPAGESVSANEAAIFVGR